MGAMRRAASLLCLAGALLATVGLLPARAQADGPVVEVFEASGVLDASVLGALRRDLEGPSGGGRGCSSSRCRASGARGRPGRGPGRWPGPGCRWRCGSGRGPPRPPGRRRSCSPGPTWSGWPGTRGSGRRCRPSWARSRPGRRGGAVRALRPPTGGPGSDRHRGGRGGGRAGRLPGRVLPDAVRRLDGQRSTGARSR